MKKQNKIIVRQFAGLLFFLLCIQFSGAQEISLELKNKIPLEAEQYVGTDSYENTYYLKGKTLYKSGETKKYNFVDLQLGKPTYVDLLNPLKIILFYEPSNAVIILDRHLIEITRVYFNRLPDFKSVGFASSAGENGLWLFNMGSQRLEIYDYMQKKTIARTQPTDFEVIDQKSNFNFCWVLTEEQLEKYNSYGSLLDRMPNDGFVKIVEDNGNLVAKKGNALYRKEKGSELFEKLILPKIEIESFYLKGKILYLYDGKSLYQYQFH